MADPQPLAVCTMQSRMRRGRLPQPSRCGFPGSSRRMECRQTRGGRSRSCRTSARFPRDNARRLDVQVALLRSQNTTSHLAVLPRLMIRDNLAQR